jgi:transcriptional regulator with GAF, ATPase, and Fis domain
VALSFGGPSGLRLLPPAGLPILFLCCLGILFGGLLGIGQDRGLLGFRQWPNAPADGRRIEAVEQATMERLSKYHWPGNVRELENILERAIILSNSSTLTIDPEVFNAAPPNSRLSAGIPGGAESLESIERNHIVAVLTQTDWVVEGPRGAAKILELHPNTLRSRMKKLSIKRGSA